MKEAQAWIEHVTYWECPHCDHLHELGEVGGMEPEQQVWCEKCGNSVLLKGHDK